MMSWVQDDLLSQDNWKRRPLNSECRVVGREGSFRTQIVASSYNIEIE